METSSVGTTGSVPSTSTPVGSSKMGKDEFMKLLLAQLGNQDPTAPVDSQAFVAQLAQFSTVELLQGANQSLDSLIMAQAASNQTSMVGLVGKDVLLTGDSLTLAKDEKPKISGELSKPADQLTVTITDATGKAVRTLSVSGAQAAGPVSIEWDGCDGTGKRLDPGSYHVRMVASKDGKDIPVEQRVKGHIAGVSFTNGVTELILDNGQHVKLSDVIEVAQPAQTKT